MKLQLLREHVVSSTLALALGLFHNTCHRSHIAVLLVTKSCEMSQQQLAMLHCKPITAVSRLLHQSDAHLDRNRHSAS